MQIEFTPEQDDVVRHAIASGRIARPEDAVAQAMAARVERERELAEPIASLPEAEGSDIRGASVSIENVEDVERVFNEIRSSYRADARAKGESSR